MTLNLIGHNAGFFSCCCVRLDQIIVFTNKPGVFVTLKEDIESHIKFVDYEFINLKHCKDLSQLPDKCVIGVSKQLIENGKNTKLLEKLYLMGVDYIVIDEKFLRTEELNDLNGDPTKLKKHT